MTYPSTSNANGIWTLRDLFLARKADIWPVNVNTLYDEYFSDVVLLLQDSLIDQSLQENSITVEGNAVADTNTKKYGSASISLPANGDRLSMTATDALNLDGQYWTIEMWINTTQTGYSGSRRLVCCRTFGISATNALILGIDNNGTTIDLVFNQGGFNTGSLTLNDGNWHHVAAVRTPTQLAIYVDGSLEATNTVASTHTINYVGQTFGIGYDPRDSGKEYAGFIDDLRITKGVARYTTNFTPPTEPFPTSSPP